MQFLRSSCATLCTTVTLSSCRTPSGVSSIGDTKTRSSCSTLSGAGPKTTTCLWAGGWGSTPPSWRRASWTHPAPSWPSSPRPWCTLDPQRWREKVQPEVILPVAGEAMSGLSLSVWISSRCNGTAEPGWLLALTFTSLAATQPACLTLWRSRIFMSPRTEERFSPWPPASPLWRSSPSESLLTTRPRRPWTSTARNSEQRQII